MIARFAFGVWIGIGAALACALAGCGETSAEMEVIPAYSPSPESVWKLKRVVLVELAPRASSPEVARELSESVYMALQGRQVFSVDLLAKSSPLCASLPEGRGPRFTLEELNTLRSNLRCDAVLVGSVTGFQPYPDAWMAAQLWLVDLRSGRILWGVDHAWRTTDSSTMARMKKYFASESNCEDGESIRLMEMSPRMMGRFVAWEMARALPARSGAVEERSETNGARKALVVTKKIFTN